METNNWNVDQYRQHLIKKKQQQAAVKKKNKYGNLRGQGVTEKGRVYNTIRDGETFDSEKEANYYDRLKIRLLAKEFKHILYKKRDLRFKLVVNDMLICTYEADFILVHWTGEREVIDVKSNITRQLPVYILKKKLMKALHNIDIVEVNL